MTLEYNQYPAHQANATQPNHFDNKQIEILKNSICKGVSNDEFEVFLMACKKTQLDPFMKQIYAVKRKSKRPDGSWGETMTIQTGIDGYRLIAERTGCYAPGPEPTYSYDSEGRLISASSYIKKQTRDGTWHTVSASAYVDEYMQTIVDRQSGEKKPSGMWGNMPRTMLAKCAEAQALRKAFPAEMSGVYTKEEMLQADIEDANTIPSVPQPVISKITEEQASSLFNLLENGNKSVSDSIIRKLYRVYNIHSLNDLTVDLYEKILPYAIENEKKHQKDPAVIEKKRLMQEKHQQNLEELQKSNLESMTNTAGT